MNRPMPKLSFWLMAMASPRPAPIEVSKISDTVPPSQLAPRNSHSGQRSHASATVTPPNGTTGTKRRNRV